MLLLFFMYRPRWVVPVLPKGELEVLLEAAIDLCKKGNALFLALVCHLIFFLYSLVFCYLVAEAVLPLSASS